MTPFQSDIKKYCIRHGMTVEGAIAVAKEAGNWFPKRFMPVSEKTRREIVAEITGGAA
jgi:hypothetical protein